ncbi:MAG: hypothetical protein JSV04_11470 [Candidatus Heimdallarchaeota archaeon]|nr:MAG: hypothetical protein JSV04_11470 [Candidatus Heimdallarchaeota archaeon]
MDSEDKWKIGDSPEDTDSTTQNFRLKYIQALTELIQNLNKEPQSSESLAEKTSNKVTDVQEALVFSKLITEKGYFQSQGSGYSQQWSLKRSS